MKKISESFEHHFGESITQKALAGFYIASAPTILTRSKANIPNVDIKPIKPWSSVG